MKSLLLRTMLACGLTLTGCATPYVQHTDTHIRSRTYAVAKRFYTARDSYGMAGVAADIDSCYAETTKPVIQAYALRDCLLLGYTAVQFNKIRARLQGADPILPYFDADNYAARVTTYGQMDSSTTTVQLNSYLNDSRPLLIQHYVGFLLANPVAGKKARDRT